jgi:predicted phosphodiesterase
MRVALLSDVHGNLPALEAALAALRGHGVDRYLSAGDAIGYGPHPSGCIDRLREIEATAVAGNHELFLQGRLPPAGFSPRARRSLSWTRNVIGPERLGWLSTLPDRMCFGPIVLAHASLDGFEEYVVRPRQATRQLELLARSFPEARILVLGHTHQPLYRPEDGRSRTMTRGGKRPLSGLRTLVNPGSIGQSRQRERLPRARFALLDLDEWSVRWFAVDYDHSEVLRDVATVGLPPDSIHVRPSAGRALARTIRTHTDLSVRSPVGAR